MTLISRWCFALLVVLCCPLASAQDSWASRDYDYANRTMNDFVNRFERNLVNPLSRSLRTPSGRGAVPAAAPATARTVSTTVAPRRPLMPQAMAGAHPAAQRGQAQQTYEQLLTGYHRIEQQFGIAPYDVAGAVAAFIAGSYMGYRNVSFPDRHFKPLVEQVRAILAADPAWAQSPLAAKQDMYEQLAIVGMLVANTQMGLARRPDAQAVAAMQSASKAYLEQLLKVDADKVRITDQGLTLR